MQYKYQKYTLENGVRVILAPDSAKEVVTTLVLFGVGSRHEPEEIAGISHVIEHMHFKGTKKRPTAMELSEFIEDIGGEHNAFTSKEYTGYYTKVAASHLLDSIEFLSDLLVNPLFDATELEKEKQVILEELKMYEDMPAEMAGCKFEEALLGKNALGREVIGYRKSIQAITRDDILKYKAEYYTASNTVIVLAGNLAGLSPEKILEVLNEKFIFPEQEVSLINPIKLSQQKFYLLEKKIEQTHIIIGFRGVSLFDKDRYVLKMLALILGGSMSSRMFGEIREKKGLAYAVRSSASSYLDAGYIETYAGVPHNKAQDAIAAVLGEYEKVKRGIKPKEIARAREIVSGRLMMRMDDSNELANHYAVSLLLTGKILTPDEISMIYGKINEAELTAAAGKYLTKEKLTVTAFGTKIDEELIEEYLNSEEKNV